MLVRFEARAALFLFKCKHAALDCDLRHGKHYTVYSYDGELLVICVNLTELEI